MPRYTLQTTDDGTPSCLDSETGEWCHNRAGAYTEALHQYVLPSGLLDKALRGEPICLLDACFGLGYNTWALFNELVRRECPPLSVRVIAIETSPEMPAFWPVVLEHPTFDPLNRKTNAREHNTYYRTLECTCDTNCGQQYEVPERCSGGEKLCLYFLAAKVRFEREAGLSS